MVVYKITNGMAHDLRFVDAPDADDIVLTGVERLPDINILHDAEHLAEITKKQAIDGIQAILDAKAKELGFDTVHTGAVWTISKNVARKARADALVAWGDAVWDFAEAEWEKQSEGKGTFTTVDEFLAALPKFPGVVA
jgi:hypothetical protein